MFYRFKFLNKTGDLIIVFKQFLQNFNLEMEVVFQFLFFVDPAFKRA
jgi:hypothetical protein